MELKERSKFLHSGVWKKFRLLVIKKFDGKCECCGVKTKRPHVHHKDMNKDNYANLDIENFSLLCNSCHDWLHDMEKRKYVPKRIQDILSDFFI